MQLDENENPEILNREMKQVLLTNVKKQQSIEFNFLEISILSVTLNTKILGENKEILCKVSFEKIDHEIQSCITSNQGKYFFPKHSMKYIMQNTSLNQNLLFSFSSSSKNDIGVCCFVIDQSVASSKRQNLPIYGSNNQIVGEVTFLPQFQDEVLYFIKISFTDNI